MSCPITVHCRQCNEALDVYVPYEDQFCSEECFAEFGEDHKEMNSYPILTNPFAWSR